MQVQTIKTEGLGDSTYIVSHQGLAFIVDPQRDIDRFEPLIESTGADLRYVLETHLHNDYISGGPDLARKSGADLILPAAAAPAYRHLPAFHMEDIPVSDDLWIRPIHTPGHTPEHTSYLVLIGGRDVALFSGGSLLVGSAGRPDLLGPERADSLARLQYRSVKRLAELPDDVGLYPTHGEGSFCTSSGVGQDTSTIGQEKAHNPMLAYSDEDGFVAGQLSSLVPWPSYYSHMGPANLYGEEPLSFPALPEITQADYARLSPDVQVVDARPKADFAAGHLPGSIAVELRRDFGTWVGWVLPYQTPLVLVLHPDQDLDDARRQLGRIGFEDIRGVITKLDSWDLDLNAYATVGVEEFAAAVTGGAQVLDARAPDEWRRGTIADSILAYAPHVAAETPAQLDRSRDVWVACETGYRASVAASHLEMRGFRPVVLAEAGVAEVLAELKSHGEDSWCAPPLQRV